MLDTADKYSLYETLLLERDQLAKEAGQIWTLYLKLFGELLNDNYKEKLECIRCKKIISYYQSAVNRGRQVEPDALSAYLDKEMASYYANLRQMQKEQEEAKGAGEVTAYEAQRSKVLYRWLARLIHPDILPETDKSEVLKDLWVRILAAYHKNSVKELSELDVLVRRALKDMGIPGGNAEIPEIDEKIEALDKEIAEIRSTEPYTLGSLVEDEEAVEKKKKELEEELISYQKYRKELEEVILKMMQDGGFRAYVE